MLLKFLGKKLTLALLQLIGKLSNEHCDLKVSNIDVDISNDRKLLELTQTQNCDLLSNKNNQKVT